MQKSLLLSASAITGILAMKLTDYALAYRLANQRDYRKGSFGGMERKRRLAHIEVVCDNLYPTQVVD